MGQAPQLWTIRELSRRSQVPVTTLRYYDRIGLVVPHRLENNHRRYAEDSLDRLLLIRLCVALGCSLPEVADVLGNGGDARTEIARRKLLEIDGRIAQLQAARGVLTHLAECRHNPSQKQQCREDMRTAWTVTGPPDSTSDASATRARQARRPSAKSADSPA